MAKLTLDQAIQIRTDYLSNLSISEISEKFKISRAKVLLVLNERDETAKRLAEENIQLKFNKQTEAIQELVNTGLTYLKEAVEAARNSEQPHLFIDKVASAIERMDKISRLNLNRATEIKESRNTSISLDVVATMKDLDTPEKQKEFLRNQLKFNDRDTKDIRRTTEVVAG